MRGATAVVAAALALLAARPAHSGGLPDWIAQAISHAEPDGRPPDSRALVLLHARLVSVRPDGRRRVITRLAIRLLDREAIRDAVARAIYGRESEDTADLQAWLVHPSGRIDRYGSTARVDAPLDSGAADDDSRVATLDAHADAGIGDVFAYEATVEQKGTRTEDVWLAQDRDRPTRVARYEVTVPHGGKAEGTSLNGPPAVAGREGDRYSWEWRDLPGFPPEPARPPLATLVPALGVRYTVMGSEPALVESWSDVARWYSRLAVPSAAPAALKARATSLVADATTEDGRIARIARFVQSIRNVAPGPNECAAPPHAPAEILLRPYADSKDKTALLRALLAEIGITARPVLARLHSTSAHERWPSAAEFDHVLTAISVDKSPAWPAAVDVPKLGRLLFFDPADPYATFGTLPEPLQGTPALIADLDAGDLVRLPASDLARDTIERDVSVTLGGEGAMQAHFHQVSKGSAGATERRWFGERLGGAYRTRIETWLAQKAKQAHLVSLTPTDDTTSGDFTLDVDFAADRYGQIMQDHLLVFRPFVISRGGAPMAPGTGTRVCPVALPDTSFSESVHVALPDGFALEDLPPAVDLHEPFGTYVANVHAAPHELTITRELRVPRATLPARDHPALCRFYEAVAQSEDTPVVLVRN